MNDLTGNPLIIDTAAAAILTTKHIYVQKVRWDAGSTAGHRAVINDQHGKEKWASQCAGANHEESDMVATTPEAAYQLGPWDGLQVPTLDSGTLLIYFYARSGFAHPVAP